MDWLVGLLNFIVFFLEQVDLLLENANIIYDV